MESIKSSRSPDELLPSPLDPAPESHDGGSRRGQDPEDGQKEEATGAGIDVGVSGRGGHHQRPGDNQSEHCPLRCDHPKGHAGP